MSDPDQYTSPLDEVDEATDYRFELPPADSGDVILVDDDDSAATLNRAILEAAGYRVLSVSRPSSALEHVRAQAPIVLVTDFDMPEMSGLDLAQRAQEIEPEVKVVLLTGSGDESTAQAALRLGSPTTSRSPRSLSPSHFRCSAPSTRSQRSAITTRWSTGSSWSSTVEPRRSTT